MNHGLTEIFASTSYLLLAGSLAAVLFFAMAGIREVRDRCLEGLLYLAIAAFFAGVHVYYLLNIPSGSPFAMAVNELDVFSWLALLFGPALMTLFLAMALVEFARSRFRVAFLKLFFGLTLLCFLYMLGLGWPVDIKAFLALFYCIAWFEIELATAH